VDMISPVSPAFFNPFKLTGRLAIQRISTTGPVHPAFLLAVEFSIQKSGDIGISLFSISCRLLSKSGKGSAARFDLSTRYSVHFIWVTDKKICHKMPDLYKGDIFWP